MYFLQYTEKDNIDIANLLIPVKITTATTVAKNKKSFLSIAELGIKKYSS